MESDFTRIVRKCPKCRGHFAKSFHHLAHKKIEGKKVVVRLHCCHCGFAWTGRYKSDEWK